MKSAKTIRLDQLDKCLQTVWRRGVTLYLVGGLLTFFRWAIPLFLVGVLIDWLTHMPTPGRIGILVTLLTVSCYRAWRGGWCHLRFFEARRSALELESHQGDLKSLLVSAIQFREIINSSGDPDGLREQTCRRAEEAASRLQPDQAVPFSGLRRPIGAVLMLSGILVVLFVMNSALMTVGGLRIFCPWLTVAYPTHTKIQIEKDKLVLKEGENALIKVGLSGVVPEEATLFLRTGEGRARRIDLKVENSSCSYTIASASRDFTYQIQAGDGRTDWHPVKVVRAPRVQQVKVDVTFPDYLARKQESVEALTLTVPEGSKLDWHISLDRAISQATFLRDGEEPVVLQVSEDGRQVTSSQRVAASSGYSFSWVEKEHGFNFNSPRYYLQVSSDQAPRVELTSPDSNLVAMIGRPLNLKARIHDDHGIGPSSVIYRVNQRDEIALEMDLSHHSGQGEQSIDWDYREALTDLKIGDTVSFSLEVRDRYPEPNGPHITRSETRRLTFLTKEDYLEQIQKKKDRLLSRVQTKYRQERSSYEVVRQLEPTADGYSQTCQIEAIRQELVRDQLKEIALEVKLLLDDLEANNVADAAEGETLEYIRSEILSIADTHLATAASRLRHQSSASEQDSTDPSFAARAVNTAARELASLVLLRSIDSAQEVYAREARMLAQVQASLRWRTVQAKSTEERAALSKEQAELAEWTQRLINDLQKGIRYEKRPLAVLRLIQSVQSLQSAKTEERMRQAGVWITQGETDQAESLQAQLITTLLDAEFSVRLSGAYSTLVKTRDQMRSLVDAQRKLRELSSNMNAQGFEGRRSHLAQSQNKLRQRLLTLLLPSIPAPRPQLFDETLPQVPPVLDLLKEVDRAMVDAIQQFDNGQQNQAVSKQKEVEQALVHLVRLVDRWSVELGLQTLGLSTLVALTSERLAFIEAYEAKVVALLEKTDLASSEEKKVEGLAESQDLLTEELASFIEDLVKQSPAQSDPDLPPLLSRLSRVEQAMRRGVESLKSNEASQALGHQEQAADIITEAHAIVTRQNEQLSLLQSLLMFQRSIRFANGYMGDIVKEQKDMIALTKALKEEEASHLMPRFGNLKRCMEDVAPLLDLIAARVDAGSPLLFAISDLEDAMTSLKDGDHLDALDAQEVATESLEQVHERVQAVKSQASYIAEIVEFLHSAVADLNTLAYQQSEIGSKIESASKEQREALAAQQRTLLTQAEKDGELLSAVTGMPVYAEPTQPMREALTQLESNEVSSAIEQMDLAEASINENAESLFAVISMLHGLPDFEILPSTDPGVERLLDVLAVATLHKALFRDTNKADPQPSFEALATRQDELAKRCLELSQVGEPHAMLKAASEELAQATVALKSSDRNATKRTQTQAMETLQHFIIEQALIFETAAPPPAASDADPDADGEGSDSESAFTAGFISDFVSGEAPKDQRSEWKVRGERNRAALNQNFARELPLEYRGLLKNYYERVAE